MKKNKFFHRLSKLDRKKPDPNRFVFTGQPSQAPTQAIAKAIDIQKFVYNKHDCKEYQHVEFSQVGPFDKPGYRYWVNIHGLSDPELIAKICKKNNIHDLVIQDILDVNQRPKFQNFDDFGFLTIKTTVPSMSSLSTEQISFVIGKNSLISFQERKADYFEHIRFRLRENTGIVRDKSPDYLLYTMLEAILDNYFKTLEQLDNEVERMDLINASSEPSPAVLETMESHKKFIHFIKKSIIPIKEFTNILEREEIPFIDRSNSKFFYEIKDLCLTLLDNCDAITSALESNVNLFFFMQGHRMNEVMKMLTIVSTIFIPLTFIAGIYGMNFSNMPELQLKYGYAGVWVVIIAIFVSMFLFFKRKKWF